MDKDRKPAETAQKTIWMSRDAVGSDTSDVYFWSRKPTSDHDECGIFNDNAHYSRSSGEIQNFPADCEALQDFADICGVTLPNHGEVVKLTVQSTCVVRKVLKEEIIKRLRAAKKYDAELMELAANMLSCD